MFTARWPGQVYPCCVHCQMAWSSISMLCSLPDGLVKKLEELERCGEMYQGMILNTRKLLKANFDLSQSHKGEQGTHTACFVSHCREYMYTLNTIIQMFSFVVFK